MLNTDSRYVYFVFEYLVNKLKYIEDESCYECWYVQNNIISQVNFKTEILNVLI